MVRQEIQYLIELSEHGGPRSEDYKKLDQTWSRIMDAVYSGNLSTDRIRETWGLMGEAFGTETLQGHVIRKPHGYVGDFEIIDRIYQYSICESLDLRAWDEYFQSREACHAVRNRKDYFIDLLSDMVTQHGQFRVLNVGSGPARDILEFHLRSNSHVLFDCVEMDSNAIDYAISVCSCMLDHVTFHHRNIFRYRNEHHYKLIWSAGLFDYLDDRSFVILLQHLVKMLEPEGQLLVGNFSIINPTKDYMEFGEWILNYRTKEDLLRLAELSHIHNITSHIGEEAQGINLFLHIVKGV